MSHHQPCKFPVHSFEVGNLKERQQTKTFSLWKSVSHGSNKADRSQEHWRKGTKEAAGHEGSAQIRSRYRRCQEAAQVVLEDNFSKCPWLDIFYSSKEGT